MRVPSTSGRLELRMRTGMFFSTAGKNGGWVKNLCAEECHFSGFGERDTFDTMAAGDDARIGREHAINVGPDLNLFGINARADDGGRVVGTAAAKGGGDAVLGGSDEIRP